MNVSISKGNTKLGPSILNTSLTPIASCQPNTPCQKSGCYALKAYRQYPNVRKAWDNNFNIYLESPQTYFKQINSYLETKNSFYFRWLVAGDIVDNRYLRGIIYAAQKNNQGKFLVFTKNYPVLSSIKKENLPKNLNIMVSAWPNYPIPKYIKENKYRIAWMQNSTETRIPKESFLCSGYCQDCLECWKQENKKDVILPYH